jgi:hypothetical protein
VPEKLKHPNDAARGRPAIPVSRLYSFATLPSLVGLIFGTWGACSMTRIDFHFPPRNRAKKANPSEVT